MTLYCIHGLFRVVLNAQLINITNWFPKPQRVFTLLICGVVIYVSATPRLAWLDIAMILRCASAPQTLWVGL